VMPSNGLWTSSPLEGEDRPRSGQMRGTIGVGSRRPRRRHVRRRSSPSSGPAGHLPPPGGKAVVPIVHTLANQTERGSCAYASRAGGRRRLEEVHHFFQHPTAADPGDVRVPGAGDYQERGGGGEGSRETTAEGGGDQVVVAAVDD